MRQMKKFLMGLVLTFLGTSAYTGECTHPNQEGCWNLVILNTLWDSENPLMKGLDKPYTTASEHEDRIFVLGMRLIKASQANAVKTAKARSFLVYVWGPAATPVAYKIRVKDGQTQSAPSSFEDVTSVAKYASFSDKKKLGPPTKVYRIRTTVVAPLAVSLQFTWSSLNRNVHMLICSEDSATVYPPHGEDFKKQGLWVMGENFEDFKQQGAPNGSIAAFVSKE